MNETITIPVELSLTNPNDPSEVTLVADAVGVGLTGPTANGGRIVRFTEEFLRDYAHTLVGTPVNVLLSADEEGVTGHSTSVVGTITRAIYDSATQKVRIFASLWRHYFPSTVEQLVKLQADKKLQVSAELLAAGDTDAQGVYTPTRGKFSGLGIVNTGADFNNRVLILAALKDDVEALSNVSVPVAPPVPTPEPVSAEIIPMSYEWAGDQIAEHLSNTANSATVVGTFQDRFYFTTNDARYETSFTVDNERLVFGEPVKVNEGETPALEWGTPVSNGGLNMPTEEEFAEIKASLATATTEANDWKGKFETLEATVTAERRAQEADKLGSTRLSEIEKIAPYTDETLKQTHLELFKTVDDKAFDTIKTLMLAVAEPKGGIASPEQVPPADPDTDPGQAEADKNLETWRAEMLATFGTPTT